MKLTAQLALNQIKINRNRSIMTLLGIVLSTAMLTAVCGYIESARVTIYNALGYQNKNSYNIALVWMGVILGAIIITASIIVVSNAFRVSAAERTRQFGILKSVGATKKQIASTVLYEGILMSIIGIPAGIAAGLLIELIGTSVITNLLNSLVKGEILNVDSEAFLNAPFAATPIMFVISIVASFGTVLLSAWLPARKAAKIPAIDAIRSTGEVKLQRRNVGTSKIIQAFFGFEGVLAAKSLKRSRRNFRATTISLTISIIMLIAAGSFGSLIKNASKLVFSNIDATVEALWVSDMNMNMTSESSVSGVDYILLDSKVADTVTEIFKSCNNAEIYGVGGIGRYNAKLPDGTETSGALITVDPLHYEKLCKAAGVSVGSNLLINLRRETVGGKKKEYVPYNFKEFKGKQLTFSLAGCKPIELTVDGELTGQDVPYEISNTFEAKLAVIVPECETVNYTWFAKVDDTSGFISFAKQVMKDMLPQPRDGIGVSTHCNSIVDVTKQMNYLVNTIMFFVYGFVGMLMLIAVTNVISTISTNIHSRAREFAVLESIGMTKAGLKKMLNLESFLCSIRSLILGLPLGLIGAYGLYRSMGLSVELPFAFPWITVAECILVVFAITWITMRYSASRLKRESLVDIIKAE